MCVIVKSCPKEELEGSWSLSLIFSPTVSTNSYMIKMVTTTVDCITGESFNLLKQFSNSVKQNTILLS